MTTDSPGAALAGLSGTTVVVTGAARGQGLAAALLLADAGARVFATDRAENAPPELSQVAAPSAAPLESGTRTASAANAPDAPPELSATAGARTAAAGGITYRRLDVAVAADWARLADELRDTLAGAPLRGLVNNAGITHRAHLGEVDESDWNAVFGVNLTGPMLGIQALAPLMGGGSSIVNVGSSAALTGHYPVAYTSSKWGLRGLTHVAATEYGPRGIRVNIVHPGYIETPMTASAPDAMREAQLALTPLERFGQPQEVARTVAFLLSDAASYISGAEIPVDGASTSSAGVKYMSDRIDARAHNPQSQEDR